jgi:hypothetical protein
VWRLKEELTLRPMHFQTRCTFCCATVGIINLPFHAQTPYPHLFGQYGDIWDGNRKIRTSKSFAINVQVIITWW